MTLEELKDTQHAYEWVIIIGWKEHWFSWHDEDGRERDDWYMENLKHAANPLPFLDLPPAPPSTKFIIFNRAEGECIRPSHYFKELNWTQSVAYTDPRVKLFFATNGDCSLIDSKKFHVFPLGTENDKRSYKQTIPQSEDDFSKRAFDLNLMATVHRAKISRMQVFSSARAHALCVFFFFTRTHCIVDDGAVMVYAHVT